jgi:hypothetical protein
MVVMWSCVAQGINTVVKHGLETVRVKGLIPSRKKALT